MMAQQGLGVAATLLRVCGYIYNHRHVHAFIRAQMCPSVAQKCVTFAA